MTINHKCFPGLSMDFMSLLVFLSTFLECIILSTGSCMSLSLQLGMDPASLFACDGDARMRQLVPCALGPRPDWATAISAMAQDL